jgi:hypothetical protein
MARHPENQEAQPMPKPAILDVVKIDGRWAQIRHGGNVVNFLDDNSAEPIDWNEYRLSKSYDNLSVKAIMQVYGEKFTEDEIKNIHWGSEQNQNPELRQEVTAFGEYVKK